MEVWTIDLGSQEVWARCWLKGEGVSSLLKRSLCSSSNCLETYYIYSKQPFEISFLLWKLFSDVITGAFIVYLHFVSLSMADLRGSGEFYYKNFKTFKIGMDSPWSQASCWNGLYQFQQTCCHGFVFIFFTGKAKLDPFLLDLILYLQARKSDMSDMPYIWAAGGHKEAGETHWCFFLGRLPWPFQPITSIKFQWLGNSGLYISCWQWTLAEMLFSAFLRCRDAVCCWRLQEDCLNEQGGSKFTVTGNCVLRQQ